MTPGHYIAIATGIGFVAMVVWAFTFGRRIDWPNGIHLFHNVDGLKVHLFVNHQDADMTLGFLDLATKCHLAVKIADEEIREWRAKREKPKGWIARLLSGPDRISEFVVYFPTEAEYDLKIDSVMRRIYTKGTNATLGQLRRPIGSGPRVAVIRPRFIPVVSKRGSPLIHEVCHTAAFDSYHSHPELWIEGAREWNRQPLDTRQRKAEWLGLEDRQYDPDQTVEAKAYSRFAAGA